MIKSYAAYTSEVDDIGMAVAEIMEQLTPEKNCLRNTVAIVTCYYEFAVNGIIAELYKALKFPIVGTTTTALATKNYVGQLGCAILMMTSDDVTLTASCSSSVSKGLERPLTDMYQEASEGHQEKPGLIISAAPLTLNYAGDHFVAALDKISGGIPNFGMLPVDDYQYEHSYIIFNDRVEKDVYGIILASGNIEPSFLYASLSPEYIFSQTAIITQSEGNLIKEANGLPIRSYLETLGLSSTGKFGDAPHSIPFVLDYSGEGIPISRVLLSWSEEGYAICGGHVPEGTKFSFGTWNKADVIETTRKTVESISSMAGKGTLLLYSCLARSYALGTDILLEANTVSKTISDRVPYIFAYTSGELCPVNSAENINSFHNNTIIACAF